MASQMGREVVEQAAERLADAGMIQFTALPEPRAPPPAAAAATARGRWRCRVCQVECGGVEVPGALYVGRTLRRPPALRPPLPTLH
ncbi:hypothetical protein OsI_38800 [Oryza sativa Indica Group]|uniref:Uncharacterized protein n=1 Tax=Oryza sativa subsp. indica TaxID=39946 RepID=B8BMK9_ORYSI|nr:hypothetical protein OsI_38800 [Oryza sativa Indica Group]